MSSIDQLRQQEYTGENRCTPCTVVNVAIAAAGGALITKTKSRLLGTTAFAASLGIIYLRGYLVPGTPTLTKRYLPDQVLRWFEKEPAPAPTDETTTIDPERVLLDASAVTPCENGTDLCLTDNFRSMWRKKVRAARERDELGEEDLRRVLDGKSEEISFEEYGDALLATTGDSAVGQWNSPAAVVADIAAATVLAERYSDWTAMNHAERARVLASLRIFVAQCPQCDGPVRVEQEAVESCCRSYDVLLSACQECDAALFEIEWMEEFSTVESDEQTDQSTSVEA